MTSSLCSTDHRAPAGHIQMTCRLGFSHHTPSSYIPYPIMFLSTPWVTMPCSMTSSGCSTDHGAPAGHIQMTCRLGFSHHTLSSYIPYPTMFLSTPWTSRLCLNINSLYTYICTYIFQSLNFYVFLSFRSTIPESITPAALSVNKSDSEEPAHFVHVKPAETLIFSGLFLLFIGSYSLVGCNTCG